MFDHVVSHVAGGRGEIPTRPKALSPIAFAQVGELHLDTAGRAALDALHDIGQGQLGRDRQEHVDMIARQHALHDMDAEFLAGLDNDFSDPFTHRALQNFIPVFRGPHDVVSVIKSRVRG